MCRIDRVGGILMSRWDMGNTTLSTLANKTSSASQDLGGLVRQLVAAAAPLEGKMNGAGRRAFESFKARSDQIAADLNRGLGSVHTGQRLMDRSFGEGDQNMAANAQQSMGSANFDAARFRG